MKSILLIPFLVLIQTIFAQPFLSDSINTFDGVSKSSIAFADVDGDNDQDVLLTGALSNGARVSTLYINDGEGGFTERTTPFDGIEVGSVAFADVDGDNDQDVLITGNNIFGDRIAKLYINDGEGNFALGAENQFIEVEDGAIAFADVDGDNDQDVVITGYDTSFTRVAKLYINNGEGSFSEMTSAPFKGVKDSDVAFADVDGDNDQDILISGVENSFNTTSTLYINDGEGNFTESTGNNFHGVRFGAVAFADVDGDNDQDVVISGDRETKLYLNDGQANFTEASGTPFVRIRFCAIALADINGDDAPDLLVSGRNLDQVQVSKLYMNDGDGNFAEVANTPFEGTWYGAVAFADVDGDVDRDVFITGETASGANISRLYINDGIVAGIDDFNSEVNRELEVYPNPARNLLFVDNGEYVIQDILGNTLMTTTVESGVIDISVLGTGQYIIQSEEKSTMLIKQ